MKIYNKILVISIVASILVGCNSESMTPIVPEIPIDPGQRYIHFDAEVSTRGKLIDGAVLEDNFMVLGYSYLGSWAGNSVMASPNVFDSTPETVVYNSTDKLYSYDRPQNWTGNTYSFFAYYPEGNADNNLVLFDDGNPKSGTPYITYELVSRSSSLGMIDIMTASYKDTNVSSSSSVPLHFRHRLAAIDVVARNYHEEYTIPGTNVQTPVYIEIVDLAVSLVNLVNQKATIYLDHTKASVYEKANGNNLNAYYPMVGSVVNGAPMSSYLVKPNNAEYRDMQFITTSSGDNASSMLVIPQTESLTFGSSQEMRYKKKYDSNGDGVLDAYITNDVNNTDTFSKSLSIVFDDEIKEGRRYYIELTFTSGAVSINVIAADEWSEFDRIDHEFE